MVLYRENIELVIKRPVSMERKRFHGLHGKTIVETQKALFEAIEKFQARSKELYIVIKSQQKEVGEDCHNYQRL